MRLVRAQMLMLTCAVIVDAAGCGKGEPAAPFKTHPVSGKVVKTDGKGTSNVGIFGGKNDKAAGDATNVVTDYVFIKCEARSPTSAFATAIATILAMSCNKPTWSSP